MAGKTGKRTGTPVSYPFGQPNIDEWLHWVVPEDVTEYPEIAVRYQGVWYVVSYGMWGYSAVKVGKGVKSKRKNDRLALYASLPTVPYSRLPPVFQLDLDKWRWLLRNAIAGLPAKEVGSAGQ